MSVLPTLFLPGHVARRRWAVYNCGMHPPPAQKPETFAPSASEGGRFSASAFFAFQGVVWSGLIISLLTVVPIFEQYFTDFEMELPIVTTLVVTLSNLMVHDIYLVALFALAGFGMIIFGYRAVSQQGARIRLCGIWGLLALLPLVLGGVILLSMVLPLLSLMQSLS